MTSYKPDQGRLTRMFAFWASAALWLYGCAFLHAQLYQRIDALGRPLVPGQVPVLGLALTGALAIAVLFAVGGVLLLLRWQNKPRTAEVLIETEKELRKVTWPTFDNLVNSSLVVVAVVLVLMGYLAGVDWFFGRIFQQLLIG
ncbi:MAG TPA: preprotein translocase subunit SecE [Planctomycetota bacterium]|nr:preprotein translocase subunit SecE [Planctomycetota bacterium]